MVRAGVDHRGAKRWPGRFKRRAGREEQKNRRGRRSRQRRPMLPELVELCSLEEPCHFDILSFLAGLPQPEAGRRGAACGAGGMRFFNTLNELVPPHYLTGAPLPLSGLAKEGGCGGEPTAKGVVL